MEKVLASVKEAKEALSVGNGTVWKLIKERRLETVKIGRRTLVVIASIRRVASGEA